MESTSLKTQLAPEKSTLKVIKGGAKKSKQLVKKGIINTLSPNFYYLNSKGEKVSPSIHVAL